MREGPVVQSAVHMPRNPQDRAFDAFYDAVRENDVLEKKTTLLLHLAVAISAGCYP